MSTKNTALKKIPDELKRLKQWVCARADSKIPMKAFERSPASVNNPDTWADFDTSVKAVNNKRYDYCGFVFNDNGLVGIDIDAGFDEYGLLTGLSADIIGRCKSYTEKSKSGRGFHIIVRGDLPFKGRNNLRGVEIYKTARYFIMTGDTILYHRIIDNQPAVDYVVDTYFPEAKRENKGKTWDRRVYNPIWQPRNDGRFPLRPTYPPIPQGSRNISLASLAGTLHTLGWDKRSIYRELTIANQTACTPPLRDYELKTICNSITRYERD